jgi:hypothetical protein
MKAAQAIANTAGAIVCEAEFQYRVKSQSNGSEYRVDLEACTCTCPDFRYRGLCKHILAVTVKEFGAERASALHEFLRDLKFNRDSAVSTSKVCPVCAGLTKLVELRKLPLEGPMSAIVEVYEKTTKCERCGHTMTIRIPTKRRAEA